MTLALVELMEASPASRTWALAVALYWPSTLVRAEEDFSKLRRKAGVASASTLAKSAAQVLVAVGGHVAGVGSGHRHHGGAVSVEDPLMAELELGEDQRHHQRHHRPP